MNTFEVGKKYVGPVSLTVYVCVATFEDRGWLHRLNNPQSLATYKWGEQWSEYIPPPPPKVKKSGWVVLYRHTTTWTNESATTSSGVFLTEEKALVSFNESTNSKKLCVAKVEWEE